jgi:caa(3)-type oxidase subunit IV
MRTEPMDHAAEERVDLAIYLSLLALTGMTLTASLLGEGRLMAVSIALIIASGKASLIVFYYMGLRRERPFLYAIVAIALAAVAILLIGLIPDLTVYRG